MKSDKLLSIDALATKVAELKASGKTIVLCHGTFDLMHVGHVKYIQKASTLGDILIVTVTADSYVNKGSDRPVFSDELRADNLAALEAVDFVAVNHAVTSEPVIERIKPDWYVKGIEYKKSEDDVTGNIDKEVDLVQQCGGQVFFTDEITFSSSGLLNKYFGVLSEDAQGFLNEFKTQYSLDDIYQIISQFKQLKVLVFGDIIIDEYYYTGPLGQVGKSDILAVRYESHERFAGGSIAVANHIAGFCDEVTLLSAMGSDEQDSKFVAEKCLPNVNTEIFQFEKQETLKKRRFLDGKMNKLFEVYIGGETVQETTVEADICQWLEQFAADYDVVVVPDFGNGLITDKMVLSVCNKAKFLAVNTQINSGNRGYHTINRYPHADFISLNEPEVRLAFHDGQSELRSVAEAVRDKVGAKHIAVTRGHLGVMYKTLGKDAGKIPALSTQVLDRVGAGDAFLSLASVAIASGVSSQMAAFIGSIAAALDLQIVCNREPIDAVSVKKYINTLFK